MGKSKKNSGAKATAVATDAPKKRGAKAGAVKRERRSPAVLVSLLEEKREALVSRMQRLVDKIDTQIATYKAKHSSRIELQNVLDTKTPEEIEAQYAEMKATSKLLKQAMKQLNSNKGSSEGITVARENGIALDIVDQMNQEKVNA